MSHKLPRLAAISGLLPASGAVQSGPDVISLFNTYGGSFTDFSGLSGGFTQVPGLLGANFHTTRDRSFFSANEVLLSVFATPVNGNTDFAGWVGDEEDLSTWVTRIVLDGRHFGTLNPANSGTTPAKNDQTP